MASSLPFPAAVQLSRGEVERNYSRVASVSTPDPGYRFSIALNKSWQQVTTPFSVPTAENPISNFGRFCRVASPFAEIEVMMVFSPREVEPADWVELYLQRAEYHILDVRRIATSSGEVGDILARNDLKQESFVSRTLGAKVGSHIFVVQCRVAENAYSEVAQEFLIALQTFQVTTTSRDLYAEPMAACRVLAPVKGQLLFPMSWIRKDDANPPPGGQSFSFANPRGNDTVGLFTFAAIPRSAESTYAGLLFNYLDQLRRNGIKIENQLLTNQPGQDSILRTWQGTLFGFLRESDAEVCVSIVEHKSGWFLLASAGPTREVDPDVYIVNRRAYRLALQTFTLQAGD